MEIITKKVSELTPDEYRACVRANFGDGGDMRDELRYARGNPHRKVFTICIWDGPHDKQSSLIAWSLVFPAVSLDIPGRKKKQLSAHFWVKSQHRQKGYGRVLMLEVKKHDKSPHVFPHSEESAEFFSSYRVKTYQYDGTWLKPGKPKVA